VDSVVDKVTWVIDQAMSTAKKAQQHAHDVCEAATQETIIASQQKH